MKNNYILLLLAFSLLSSCYNIETKSDFNNYIHYGESYSRPIYLSFRKTPNSSMYIIIKKTSTSKYYNLLVRWQNKKKGDMLFDGYDSKLNFLINNEKILSFSPHKRPKVISYNLDDWSQVEEAEFLLNVEEFKLITFANKVSIELLGRNNSIYGDFNHVHSFKAFRDFYMKSV